MILPLFINIFVKNVLFPSKAANSAIFFQAKLLLAFTLLKGAIILEAVIIFLSFLRMYNKISGNSICKRSFCNRYKFA